MNSCTERSKIKDETGDEEHSSWPGGDKLLSLGSKTESAEPTVDDRADVMVMVLGLLLLGSSHKFKLVDPVLLSVMLLPVLLV